jgi:N4-(beta-N-acetylglucosaminyl)-L-asparaginase
MSTRRNFIRNSAILTAGVVTGLRSAAESLSGTEKKPDLTIGEGIKPIVISTWNHGLAANEGAWKVLSANGNALDAVEKGVMVTEDDMTNLSVGLGGLPDRDGVVTLDASIMDEKGRCGSVAALQRIKHPISVARMVMEKTPHVMLVSEGAQKFAIDNGFPLEPKMLSKEAEKQYRQWIKTSQYKPVMNIENHDTIGMVALDASGNLSGSCTTSGLA